MKNKIKKVAQEAAQEAGELLLKRFKTFSRKDMKLKSKRDLVTKADLDAEKIILNKIKKNFPKHALLSEEAGSNKKRSDYQWVVDPLDGTTNFTMHNPLWAVSIAVVRKGEPILALINAPFLKEVYTAEKDKGAKLNKKAIEVSKIKPEKVLNTFCHGSRKKDVKRALKYYVRQKMNGFDCRQLGAASLELCFVASGRVESIAIPGSNPWDVAAGALMVREAGGKVSDFKGKKWDLKSADILASNGRTHKDLVNVLKKI